MHGLIYSELARFAHQRIGPDAWNQLLQDARLAHRRYRATENYPSDDLAALVYAASKTTGLPADTLVEAFGRFLVPTLLELFAVNLHPDWRTLDVIEHTEEAFHVVVRNRLQATPPPLKVRRLGPAEVRVRYASQRRLCSLARGIMLGVAHHYGEAVDITEASCMKQGAGVCDFHVRLAAGADLG